MRFYFLPAPEPKRVLVSTDVTASHLRALGLSTRAIARALGCSPSTAHKLATPGRSVLRETADRALALGYARNGAGYLRQTAVRSSHGLRTTQPVRAETNVAAFPFTYGTAGAASRESWTSSPP